MSGDTEVINSRLSIQRVIILIDPDETGGASTAVMCQVLKGLLDTVMMEVDGGLNPNVKSACSLPVDIY